MNQEKIKEIINNLQDDIDKLKSLVGDENSSIKSKKKTKRRVQRLEDFELSMINKIKDCKEAEKIEIILGTNSLEGKILTPYYISYKYFNNKSIKPPEIETILKEFIKERPPRSSNIARKIRNDLNGYFQSEKTRAKGRSVDRCLNSRGVEYFEQILNEE